MFRIERQPGGKNQRQLKIKQAAVNGSLRVLD
jgi:hypothetical protein